jgi:DNA topoisomerase-1
MPKKLIIVESPAKVKTILKFLSKDYDVVSSNGHVRALPSKNGSVDIDNNFTPLYQILPEKKKVIDEIKRHLKGIQTIYLATDRDREGEAIAWHLSEVLNVKKKNIEIKRITFNEITKRAVTEALKNPRDIALDLVNAQKARVVLDYLVGFNLSPFLWKKVRYGLSAGRVQSVALRLVCEREQEIKDFVVEEYWTITSELYGKNAKKDTFNANLTKIDNKKIDKMFIKDKKQADSLLDNIKKCDFVVDEVSEKNVKRNPAPPFITSTLQQEASRKLHFGAKKTMMTAQKLYEGISVKGESVGLITYMRTDSVRMADEAKREIAELIKKKYGDDYTLKGGTREFKSKVKRAQEAHEAIRPTHVENTPKSLKKYLNDDAYKLYELIWNRAVASQMASAEFKNVSADIKAGEKFVFHATGSTMLFDGFLKVYKEGKDNQVDNNEYVLLPELKKGQPLNLKELFPTQHFTQPPPRYSEATLVKTLEENGIGRPSTYANIVNTLIVRKYVHLESRRFIPDDVGMIVSKLLSEHFKKYVDYDFTASLEEELDGIAHGEKEWEPFVKNFWEPFISKLNEKDKAVKKSDVTSEDTDKICPECKGKLKIKLGKAGRFYGCSNFPDCKHTAPLEDSSPESKVNEVTKEICEKCGKPMVIKAGRFGKFLGCSGYPDCRNIHPLHKPEKTGVKCPECKEGEITKKMSMKFKRPFYSCDKYPKCKFILNFKPVPKKCPNCSGEYLLEKSSKNKGKYLVCPKEGCDYTKIPDEK